MILFLVCSYLIGAIPFGLIAGKVLKGVDVRDYGSGNIGATNVIRVCGKPIGYLVFTLDVLKGFIPTFLAGHLLFKGFDNEVTGWFTVVCGVLAVLGHTFSCFLKFKGGKGVCTALGVVIGLDWRAALIGYGVFLLVLAITRYVSLGSILGALSVFLMFVFVKYFNSPLAYKVVGGILFLGIIFTHKSNIQRLLNGTESKFGQKINTEDNGDNKND